MLGNETPSPAVTGNGGVGLKAGIATAFYYPAHEISRFDMAALRIARRFSLAMPTARTVCELSGFGQGGRDD